MDDHASRSPLRGALPDRAAGGALPGRSRSGRPRPEPRGEERGREGREEDGEGPRDGAPGRGEPSASAFPGGGGGVRRAPRQAARQARIALPADAQETVAAQKALAHAIAAKRAKAKPGDIFRPEVQPLFRRLIAEQLQGPDALDARKAVLEGNPEDEDDSVPVVVRVNAEYPPGAPRSTVPPSVLLTLPPLPACLHYRFVDRDLVLVDSVAQLIVDFLPAAAPDLAVK